MVINKKNIFWGMAVLFVVLYGFVAFEAGLMLNTGYGDEYVSDEQVQEAFKEISAGKSTTDTYEKVDQVTAIWGKAITYLTDEQYYYGDPATEKSVLAYSKFSDTTLSSLGTHAMLGILVMSLGILQFIPQFRRKYRKLHRLLGAGYLIVGFITLGLSGHYLFNAGAENIFNGYIFYSGLATLLFMTLASLLMGIFYITRKRIDLHLGWQALGFGMFLSAPIQRFDWMILAALNGNTTFELNNTTINVFLIVQCILAAYLLFFLNRESSPINTKYSVLDKVNITPLKFIASSVAVIASIGLYIKFYLVSPGYEAHSASIAMIPSEAIIHHQAIFNNGLLRWLVALPSISLLLLCLYNFKLALENKNIFSISDSSFVKNLPFAIVGLATFTGIVHGVWAYELGLGGDLASNIGGWFNGTVAMILLMFSGLSLKALKSNNIEQFNEFVNFIVAACLAPAIIFALLTALSIFQMVPIQYIESGQGLAMACTAAITGPTLIAYLMTIYGKYNNNFRIN